MAKNPKMLNDKMMREAQKKLAVKLMEQQNNKKTTSRSGNETERHVSGARSNANGKESSRRNKSSSDHKPRQE